MPCCDTESVGPTWGDTESSAVTLTTGSRAYRTQLGGRTGSGTFCDDNAHGSAAGRLTLGDDNAHGSARTGAGGGAFPNTLLGLLKGSSLAEERGLASFLSLIAPSICRHRSNSARQFANSAVTQGGPLLSMLGRTLPGLARQSSN